jgi:hypothetical protein
MSQDRWQTGLHGARTAALPESPPKSLSARQQLTDITSLLVTIQFSTPDLKLIILSDTDPRTDEGLGRFDRWGIGAVLDHLQPVFVESGRPIGRVSSQRPMCLWAALAP